MGFEKLQSSPKIPEEGSLRPVMKVQIKLKLQLLQKVSLAPSVNQSILELIDFTQIKLAKATKLYLLHYLFLPSPS